MFTILIIAAVTLHSIQCIKNNFLTFSYAILLLFSFLRHTDINNWPMNLNNGDNYNSAGYSAGLVLLKSNR